MDAPFQHLAPATSSYSSTARSNRHRMLRMLEPSLSLPSLRNIPPICFAKKRPWDSNAESFRKRKLDFRYGDDDDDDDEDEDDDQVDEIYQSWIDEGSTFLDKAINNIFIFKVLKSYGWMLPFIIISMLLVSGPKAFLLTLGLMIGLSLIVYAFQNLFGVTLRSPGSKYKREKRSYTATKRSNVYAKPDSRTRARKKGSKVSWASKDDNSVGKSVQGNPYGGWDELDGVEYMAEPVKMPDQTRIEVNNTVDSKADPVKIPDETRVRSELDRMNRSRREMARTPLLLRLLIAAFPFLSSWIKLF